MQNVDSNVGNQAPEYFGELREIVGLQEILSSTKSKPRVYPLVQYLYAILIVKPSFCDSLPEHVAFKRLHNYKFTSHEGILLKHSSTDTSTLVVYQPLIYMYRLSFKRDRHRLLLFILLFEHIKLTFSVLPALAARMETMTCLDI